MKRLLSLLLSAAMALSLTQGIALAAQTELSDEGAATADVDEVVYGTMNIPYASFYKAEGVTYEVDAVTTATGNKYKGNSDTGLVKGTYYTNADGSDSGSILGVTYPVAISSADLAKLEESGNTYSFTASETTPAAYKLVTVDEAGAVSFSEVQGEKKAAPGISADSISTNTNYGDYQVDLSGITYNGGTVTFDSDDSIHTVYGVLLTASDGTVYAMRHLENIWRGGELAWSTGFVTVVHGGEVSYENFVSMMGKTIDQIAIITENGSYTVDTDLYVPVKFDGALTVEDAMLSDGSTTFTVTGLPEDYAPEYSVAGLEISVSGSTLTFPTTAEKGKYTLTVSDANYKYADLVADFELKTADMPAAYDADARSLAAASGFTAEDLTSYIASISSVSVDGTSYAPSGRGSVKIINEDGSINLEASCLAEAKVYDMVVASTGYLPLSFTLDLRAAQTITVGVESYTKTYGDKAFTLGAQAAGGLTYKSSNTKVATVSSAGKVTIKGVGTATITITAEGTDQALPATKTVKVTVKQGTQTITVGASSYTKTLSSAAFSLKEKASGKLTYQSSNTKVVTVSSAGKVTVKGVGKATITVTAAATTNYKKATKTVTVTVNPTGTKLSSVKNISGKKMTVKWSKNSKVTGYQIQYSTSSKFTSAKTVTVKSYKTTSKTISKLTKKKKYYVRIRTYKTVSGKTYYSSWSGAKSVTIKK